MARSKQACALGAAMAASVAAGVYNDLGQAQKKMGRGFEKEYYPIADNVEKYKSIYQQYKKFGELVENNFN